MKTVTLTSKTLDMSAIARVAVQYDAIDTVHFVIPKTYDGTNLTALDWYLRYVLASGDGDHLPLTVTVGAETMTADLVLRDGIVSMAGRVDMQLVAVEADGDPEIDSVFQSEPGIMQVARSIMPRNQAPTVVLWSYYLDLFSASLTAAQAAAQAAQTAQGLSETAKDAAVEARTGAEAAQSASEAAKVLSQAARDAILNDAGFQAVVADILGDDTIGTVAGIAAQVAALALIVDEITSLNAVKADVTSLNSIKAAVSALALKVAEITALGSRTTEIDALYAQLETIAAKANQSDLEALAGASRTTETVYQNAQDIKTKADKTALATTDEKVATIQQTLNSASGVSFDTVDIGSVALPAKSTGRALAEVRGRTVTNLVQQSSLTGWTAAFSTHSIDAGVITNTGNGADPDAFESYNTGVPVKSGDVVFMQAEAYVTNSDCGYLRLNLDGTTFGTDQLIMNVNTPVANQKYILYGIATVQADFTGNIRAKFMHHYTSSAVQSGKSLKFEKTMAINLTTSFATPPSAADCLKYFATYFAGTKSVGLPMMLRGMGKNKFDLNAFLALSGSSTYYSKNSDGDLIQIAPDYRTSGTYPMFATLPAGTYKWTVNTANIVNWDMDTNTSLGGLSFFTLTKQTRVASKFYANAGTNLGKVQLEFGSTATSHEPHKVLDQYLPSVTDLRSVPSVYDRLFWQNGELWREGKVGVGALSAEKLGNYNFATVTGTDWASWIEGVAGTSTITNVGGKPRLYSPNGDQVNVSQAVLTTGKLYKMVIDIVITAGVAGFEGYTGTISVTGVYTLYFISSATTFVIKRSGAGSDFIINSCSIKEIAATAGAPKAIALQTQVSDDGTNGQYELATPTLTKLPFSGNLLSYPSGSVSALYQLPDAGLYTTKGSILLTAYPIVEIISLEKVVGSTRTVLTDGVITEAGLSFTSASLTAGDLWFLKYRFAYTGISPQMSVNALNNDRVVLDSVNGKYYTITHTVASGVPTVVATEVA